VVLLAGSTEGSVTASVLSGPLRLAIAGGLTAAVVLLGVTLGGSAASAQPTTVSGGSWNFKAGSSGNVVHITAVGLPSTGLGAADITVAFNASVLRITACGTGGLAGACNLNAPGGPTRAAGFKATAITSEPAVIATLTFDCIGAGGTSSALTITVNELLDGTPGNAQPLDAAVQHGTVLCSTTPPPNQWGTFGDIPVPGDYNGDGKTDFAVWRPGSGTWFVRNITNVHWGVSTDIPVPGDYNGDGKTDFAVWRPASGTWFVRNIAGLQWGVSTDIPVPGDYNGDGKTDFAVWRPASGTWFVRNIAGLRWGVSTDIPVPGDYNGDGKNDFAVWRPSSGIWFVR